MDKFPLMWEGRSVGELALEPEPLYTWFTARCRLPGEGLWCAWAVGDRGELRLGVLEPRGDRGSIRKRLSRRETEPLGRLLRGELRLREEEPWQPLTRPESVFRTPWLCRRLGEVSGGLTRRTESGREVALPLDPGRPFPLPPLFCLARTERIGEGRYAVFRFDGEERPVLPP